MAWKDTPSSQKTILILMALALSIWLGKFALATTLGTLNQYNQQIREVKSEIENLALAEHELDKGQALEKLQQEAQRLAQLLPDDVDGTALLESTMARYEPNGPIEFEKLEPQEIELGEISEAEDGSPIYGPSRQPIRLRFLSNYKEMVRYLHYLESQDWLLSTDSLHTRTHPDNPSLLMTDALITIALAPGSERGDKVHQKPNLDPNASSEDSGQAVSDIQTVKFVPLTPTYDITEEEADEDPNRTNRILETLTDAAVEPNDTPLPPPDFDVDGLWQEGVVINGELYQVGQSVKAWTIKAVNKKTDTVIVQQKQHIVRIQVE